MAFGHAAFAFLDKNAVKKRQKRVQIKQKRGHLHCKYFIPKGAASQYGR